MVVTTESIFYSTIPNLSKIYPMERDIVTHEYTCSFFLRKYGLNLTWIRVLIKQMVGFEIDIELKYVLKRDDLVEYCFIVEGLR